MARKSTIDIKIVGDASKLNRVLGDTQTRLGKFGDKMKTVGKTAGLAFAGMGAAAIVAAPKILEAGVELDALAKKSETVFEDSLPAVQRWAKENAAAMGLTTDRLVGLAAGTADLLKPMGLSAQAAADMAMETNELAGALSAWTGGQRSATEVSEILTKAYLGEREGLKSLGISITEADVSARLLAKGQQDLTGAALEQAKALATQELIMEKSTDAQTAWNDGSMDGVKAQNEARASIERVKESLVKALAPAIEAALPLIETLATWIGEHLPQAVEAVRRWFDENWPAIQAVIESFVQWFQQNAVPAIRTAADIVVDVFNVVKGVVDAVWPGIRSVIEGAIQAIRAVIQTVTALIRGDWEAVWNGIRDFVSGVWGIIQGIIQTAIAAVRLLITGGLELIKAVWETAWGAIKTFFSNTWDSIKSLASGAINAVVGFVTALPGRIASAAMGAFQPIIDAIQWVIDKAKEAWDWIKKISNPANLLPSGGGGRIDVQNVIDQAGASAQMTRGSGEQSVSFAGANFYGTNMPQQTIQQIVAEADRLRRLDQ